MSQLPGGQKTTGKSVLAIILASLAAAIGAVVGGAVAKRGMSALFGPTITVDEALIQAAAEINKSAPVHLDNFTRLDKAIARPGKTLVYQYTVMNMNPLPDRQQFIQAMRPSLVNNYQSQRSMAELRKQGVKLAYEYRDPAGKDFARIEILATDVR